MYKTRKVVSGLQSDFVASCLRSQIESLQKVLGYLEDSQEVEPDYVRESLKRVEKALSRLRNSFLNN